MVLGLISIVKSNPIPFLTDPGTRVIIQYARVVPDTDLAGYLANNFAGYRIFGWPDTEEIDR